MTANNVIQEFFIPIAKIKPKKEEEPIPELMYVPDANTIPSNPKVAEWVANIKKKEAK